MKISLKILGILIAAVCAAQKHPVEAVLPAANIEIDANIDDWGNKLLYYDPVTKLAYSIANNEENIYLAVRLSDQMMQVKVLRTGLVVSIDTTGKGKSSIKVNYPLVENATKGQFKGRPNLESEKSKFLLTEQLMSLAGFSNSNGKTPLKAANGVEVKLGWDENEDMIYELKIPFSSFCKSTIGPADFSKTLTLNLSIPAIEPASEHGTSSGTGSRNGGMGPPSWVRNRSSGDFQVMLQEQRLRLKFTLVNQ